MGFAPLSRLTNGLDVFTFRERGNQTERNKEPTEDDLSRESEAAAGVENHPPFSPHQSQQVCISIKELKRRLGGVGDIRGLVIHQQTIGGPGGGGGGGVELLVHGVWIRCQ